MNDLAYRLGVSLELSSYDLYFTYGSDVLIMAPCPVFALLAINPMTEACRGCSPSVVQVSRPRRAGNLVSAMYYLWLRAYRLSTLHLQCCVFRDNYTQKCGGQILGKAVPLRMERESQNPE